MPRAHLRQLVLHVGADTGMELAVIVQDTQGVFAHFLSGKEFRGRVGEVQAQLHAFAMHLSTEFVVGQQEICRRHKMDWPSDDRATSDSH